MRGPGVPTLDQMSVLLAVADAGSLAAAARRLGRAPSAISYALDNLENQLGLPLFERVTTRHPRLTKRGEAIVAEARAVFERMDALRAKVKGLLDGLEAEVALAVDVMLPTARLVDALQAFRLQFPTVTLRLHVEALGAITELVMQGKAIIGISGVAHTVPEGLEQVPIGGVLMLPVAAPSHPLSKSRHNRFGDLKDHVQLVLTDRSPLTAGRDFGVTSDMTWRLADLGAKHALLLAGVGWGNMPEPMVRDDLADGRLVVLDVAGWKGAEYALQIIYRTAVPPGPAARWLIERFASQAGKPAPGRRRRKSMLTKTDSDPP
jgi:DNA-binding transcriptional LysR family regulator